MSDATTELPTADDGTKLTVPKEFTDGIQDVQQHHKPVSGAAMASMICAIMGLIIPCFMLFRVNFGIGYVGIIVLLVISCLPGPIAICLGVEARKMIHQYPEYMTGHCQATAGIIMGCILLPITIIFGFFVGFDAYLYSGPGIGVPP